MNYYLLVQKNLQKSKKEYLEERLKTVPIGRFSKPCEIGDLACYLASPKASFITGTTLVIDGGQARSY